MTTAIILGCVMGSVFYILHQLLYQDNGDL